MLSSSQTNALAKKKPPQCLTMPQARGEKAKVDAPVDIELVVKEKQPKKDTMSFDQILQHGFDNPIEQVTTTQTKGLPLQLYQLMPACHL